MAAPRTILEGDVAAKPAPDARREALSIAFKNAQNAEPKAKKILAKLVNLKKDDYDKFLTIASRLEASKDRDALRALHILGQIEQARDEVITGNAARKDIEENKMLGEQLQKDVDIAAEDKTKETTKAWELLGRRVMDGSASPEEVQAYDLYHEARKPVRTFREEVGTVVPQARYEEMDQENYSDAELKQIIHDYENMPDSENKALTLRVARKELERRASAPTQSQKVVNIPAATKAATPATERELISSKTALQVGGIKVPFAQKTTQTQAPVAPVETPAQPVMSQKDMLAAAAGVISKPDVRDPYRDVAEDLPKSWSLRTLPEIVAFASTADTPAKRAIALEAAARVQVQPRNALEALGIGVQGSARSMANVARVKSLFPKTAAAGALEKAQAKATLDFAKAKRLQAQAIADAAKAKKTIAQTKDIDAKRAGAVDLLIAKSTKARADIIIGLERAKAAMLRARKTGRSRGRAPSKVDISDLTATLHGIDKVGSSTASELKTLNIAKRKLDAVPGPGPKPTLISGGVSSTDRKLTEKWETAKAKKDAAIAGSKTVGEDIKSINKSIEDLKKQRSGVVKQIGMRRGTKVKAPSKRTAAKPKQAVKPTAEDAF